jgi:superoxide reductase
MVILSTETAAAGKVTLLARQSCNLHGLWEGSVDMVVT